MGTEETEFESTSSDGTETRQEKSHESISPDVQLASRQDDVLEKLKNPAWQGVGGVAAVLSVVVALLSMFPAVVVGFLGMFPKESPDYPEAPEVEEAAQILVDWPLTSGSCSGTPVAVDNQDLSVGSFGEALSITEDPRTTAAKLGGFVVGSGRMSVQVRNVSDTSLYLESLRLPSLGQRTPTELDWQVDSGDGCGGGGTGEVRSLLYNLDDQTLLTTGGTFDGFDVSDMPPEFVGTEIAPGDSLRFDITVVSCFSSHEFTVVVDLSNPRGEETLIPLEFSDSLRLTAPVSGLREYLVVGDRESPTGRSVIEEPQSNLPEKEISRCDIEPSADN